MKNEYIGIRVSKNQKNLITDKAEELKLPISLFVRNLVLNYIEKENKMKEE